MSQKLPVKFFEWIEKTPQLNEDFIKKNYHEEIDEGYFLKVEVHCSKKLYELHMSERMELGKIKKLVTSLCDKNESAIHIRNLKQALTHVLVLKNFVE